MNSSDEHRSLAAIMFTDMVGYSALAQADEALAIELLEEQRSILRALFTKHHGHEIEAIGDGFFVEFASSLECVQCAIDIQKTLFSRNDGVAAERRIRVRIGLHVGDVVHKEGRVHGHGVNIAARLEPIAPPGGICLSEDIARQITNKIDLPLEKLGAIPLKNISQPMSLYRVVLPWDQQPRGSSVQSAMSVIGKHRRAVIVAVIAIVAVAAFSLFVFKQSSVGREHFLAVLPFKNMNEKGEGDYFSDGITEDVIMHLSRVNRFRVTSRTSIMPYKNSEKSLQDIGRELGVQYVLEGSVRRVGDRIRIVAQLIDAAIDAHIWSETYDQDYTNILSIQTDVAKKIAKALQPSLTPTETQRIESPPTENLEAYELYMKGRYQWNKRMPAALHKSVTYFQEAIRQDSTFTIAYAGLADAYILLGDYTELRPEDAFAKAKAMAQKAIRLDPDLPEAHTSLGYAIMHYDWDWEAASKEFERAIQLSPNSAQAHSWYALLQAVRGKNDEAIRLINKAQELDPFSAVIRTDAGLVLYLLRKYEMAKEQCRKAMELDPMFGAAYMLDGALKEQTGRNAEAIERYSQISAMSPGHQMIIAALGHAFAAGGKKEDAENMLELLQDKAKGQYVASYCFAAIYAGLEQRDQSIAWLERAYHDRDGLLLFLAVDPRFDKLRTDIRFMRLLKQIGF